MKALLSFPQSNFDTSVAFTLVLSSQGQLAVPPPHHGAVDVELVDDELLLEPPALRGGLLRVNLRGKHAVVVEVIEVV